MLAPNSVEGFDALTVLLTAQARVHPRILGSMGVTALSGTVGRALESIGAVWRIHSRRNILRIDPLPIFPKPIPVIARSSMAVGRQGCGRSGETRLPHPIPSCTATKSLRQGEHSPAMLHVESDLLRFLSDVVQACGMAGSHRTGRRPLDHHPVLDPDTRFATY